MAVSGNYIADTQVSNWPTGYGDTEKEAVITRVEALVEQVTGTIFYTANFDVKLNGNDRNQVVLRLNAPILSITAVYISDTEVDSSWYTFDDYSVHLDPTEATGGDGLAELLHRLGQTDALFPRGVNNIRITGTYGTATVPAGVTQACIILAKYDNDSTLYTAYADADSEKIGDEALARGDRKYMTGVLEADRWLRGFVQKSPGLSA